jgi:hypothetical protein
LRYGRKSASVVPEKPVVSPESEGDDVTPPVSSRSGSGPGVASSLEDSKAPLVVAAPVIGEDVISGKQKGPVDITSAKMRSLNSKGLARLRRLGVHVIPAKGLSYIANQLRLHPGKNFVIDPKEKNKKGAYLGSLYAVNKLPKAAAKSSAGTSFFTHPGAAKYLNYLRSKGANVYVDPSLGISNMRSYVRRGRFIGVTPDISWQEFQNIYRYYLSPSGK